MAWTVIWEYRAVILQGLEMTLLISVLSIIGSTLLGTLIGCLKLGATGLLHEVTAAYIEIVRNIPVLVKLFFLYYIVGLNAFPSGLIALIVHQSGYIADVIAAGFRSLPAEQREAGFTQGLTQTQILRHVLLPQVGRIVLPPMTSQFIEVVKNSAVAMFVGVQELTFQTQEVVHDTLRAFEAAVVATVLYVAITLTIAGLMSLLNRRLRWAS